MFGRSRYTDVLRHTDTARQVRALVTTLQNDADARQFRLPVVDSAFRIPALALTGGKVGDLMIDNGDGTVSLADASTPREASGVVIETLGGMQIVWSPLALLWMPLVGTPNGAAQNQVWLGTLGSGIFTAPTTLRWINQVIGKRIAFNAATGLYRVLVNPSVGFVNT